jgi:hypothetical protein
MSGAFDVPRGAMINGVAFTGKFLSPFHVQFSDASPSDYVAIMHDQ